MNQTSAPLILAIDTSCDDTAVAVVRGSQILSNVVASQVDLHKPYGGVFPTVAKQAHREHLPLTVDLALKRAHIPPADLTGLAVTRGPGLAPALEIGLEYAQHLSHEWHKPVWGINHLEGHLVSVLAQPKSDTAEQPSPTWPALGLIISGGHTEFLRVNALGDYQRLGGTIDDAAGEVLDKVGRMLDLGYPAGPVMEELARRGSATAFKFPLPMTTSGDYNVSFSGLKTFARNKIEADSGLGLVNQQYVFDFAASFQYAVFRSICYKLNKLLPKEHFEEVWLGGGVAANVELRRQLRATLKPFGLRLSVPYSKRLCGDNAAMIGVAAALRWQTDLLPTDQNLDRRPRWPLA